MIVSTMNFEEIAKAYQNDYQMMREKCIPTLFGRRNKLRRYLLKHKHDENLDLPPIFHTTKNRNNYLILIGNKNYKDFMNNGLKLGIFMHYLRNDGIWVTQLVSDPYGNTEQVFYTPHLFQRYKERCLQDTSISTMKAIESFFKDSGPAGHQEDYCAPGHPECIFVTFQNGILLGERCGSILIYKTFLSHDILKESQVQLATEGKEVIHSMGIKPIDIRTLKI